MKRFASLVLLLAAVPAPAQDIPLSQILVEGHGWRRVSKDNKGEWEFAEKLRSDRHPGVAAANDYLYYIDSKKKIVSSREDKVDDHSVKGLETPSGIALWPDGRTLVVGDADGKHLWAFRTEKDGKLTCGDRYYALRVKPGQRESGVSALTVDSRGLVYACTPLGVQVFDPTGRMCGVLTKPTSANPTAIAFGGPDRDLLFVAHGDEVYVRKTQAKGVAPK